MPVPQFTEMLKARRGERLHAVVLYGSDLLDLFFVAWEE